MQDRKRMRLGMILLEWRTVNKLSVRAAAKELGLHYATLNRFERGENPDARTLAKVIFWMLTEI